MDTSDDYLTVDMGKLSMDTADDYLTVVMGKLSMFFYTTNKNPENDGVSL